MRCMSIRKYDNRIRSKNPINRAVIDNDLKREKKAREGKCNNAR